MVTIMQDNKNTSFSGNRGGGQSAVCIDTQRVLDSCRDRDCFEDVRVYLSAAGQGLLQQSTNLRTRSAEILCAFVGVEEVPFNCGFYQVTVRYYITVEFEVCIGGRSQTLNGLTVVQKDVILYGGEGRAISFASGAGADICAGCSIGGVAYNDPIAIAETVEPVVLGTKLSDCNCSCNCNCTDFVDIPQSVQELFGEDIIVNGDGAQLLVSLGIFSVIRIVRPTQLIVQATDYCVPDKECTPASSNDNPCALFKNMPFPVSQFRGIGTRQESGKEEKGGNCGCGRN